MFPFSARKKDTKTKVTGEYYYKEGWRLYGSEKYEKARTQFIIAAEDFNFTHAQVMIGFMYYHGLGCEVNTEQSMMWFCHAAEKGDVAARHNLKVLLNSMVNYNMTKDHKLAMSYFKNAIDKGYISTKYVSGQSFEHGCNDSILHTSNISYLKEESSILLPHQEPNSRYSRGESSCQKPDAFFVSKNI